MKKILAPSITLGCLIASMSCATAFADDAAPVTAAPAATPTVAPAPTTTEAAPATTSAAPTEAAAPAKPTEAAAAETPVVSLSTTLLTRLFLLDTTTDTNPHFAFNTIRLGANVSLGRVNGKLVFQFTGNNSTNSANQSYYPESTGGVGIREAWVTYSLAKKLTTYEVTAEVGRFLPNGATSYGADPTTGLWAATGNFDSTDGFALNVIATPGNASITAQAAATSSMPIWAFTSNDTTGGTNTIGAMDSNFGGAPNNSSLALIGSLQLNDKITPDVTVEAAGAYGYRPDARIGSDPISSSFATQSKTTAEQITAGTQTTSGDYIRANLSYYEVSAGIHYKTLALGAWYTQANLTSAVEWNPADVTAAGGSQSLDPASNATTPADTSTQYQVYGAGLQGDSSMFGVEDIAAKNDVLTYGLGVQFMSKSGFDNNAHSATAVADSIGNNSYLMSAGTGYQNSVFTVSLNYAYFGSNNSVFTYTDTNTNTSAQKLYVMTSLAL